MNKEGTQNDRRRDEGAKKSVRHDQRYTKQYSTGCKIGHT